jgi:hypothetical protein
MHGVCFDRKVLNHEGKVNTKVICELVWGLLPRLTEEWVRCASLSFLYILRSHPEHLLKLLCEFYLGKYIQVTLGIPQQKYHLHLVQLEINIA